MNMERSALVIFSIVVAFALIGLVVSLSMKSPTANSPTGAYVWWNVYGKTGAKEPRVEHKRVLERQAAASEKAVKTSYSSCRLDCYRERERQLKQCYEEIIVLHSVAWTNLVKDCKKKAQRDLNACLAKCSY